MADASSDAIDTEGRSALLELPAEIRNQIWEFAIEDFADTIDSKRSTPFLVRTNATWAADRGQIKGRVHPSLHVCRQIRSEALAMFYSSITLNGEASSVLAVMKVLKGIAAVNIKAVKIYSLFQSGAISHIKAEKELKEFRESATAAMLGFQGTSEVFVLTSEMKMAELGGYVSDPVAEQKKAEEIASGQGLL